MDPDFLMNFVTEDRELNSQKSGHAPRFQFRAVDVLNADFTAGLSDEYLSLERQAAAELNEAVNQRLQWIVLQAMLRANGGRLPSLRECRAHGRLAYHPDGAIDVLWRDKPVAHIPPLKFSSGTLSEGRDLFVSGGG